jgi:hypothetical protein
VVKLIRDVAQPGSVPAWGAGGRWFESSHPDQTRFERYRTPENPLIFRRFCFMQYQGIINPIASLVRDGDQTTDQPPQKLVFKAGRVLHCGQCAPELSFYVL